MIDQSIHYMKLRLESAVNERLRLDKELANAKAAASALQGRYDDACTLCNDLERGLQLLKNSQGIVDKATSV